MSTVSLNAPGSLLSNRIENALMDPPSRHGSSLYDQDTGIVAKHDKGLVVIFVMFSWCFGTLNVDQDSLMADHGSVVQLLDERELCILCLHGLIRKDAHVAGVHLFGWGCFEAGDFSHAEAWEVSGSIVSVEVDGDVFVEDIKINYIIGYCIILIICGLNSIRSSIRELITGFHICIILSHRSSSVILDII